ncbi:TIR domain-containing protein [Granulicella mallensis]|uniref:SEFIR domain-containing protein n=1 Tax=Granulicella mallensis TaxID=940614 RepID=A0A7W7ZMP8_9BACT|nr:TIR domain-containing protein [Granulicella mallensis]MBB5062785.1 hypothetical protein [Granulicella mallensis]
MIIDEIEKLPPQVFVSYSWDSVQHRKWVLAFATRLRGDGIDVILDQWALQPGGDRTQFMEMSVTNAERVLIVCTDRYAKKAGSRTGGVGYEAMIITSEIAARIDSDKFVPILRADEFDTASPVWLRTKIGVDLRGDPYSEEAYQTLLRSLHRQSVAAPAIGPVPSFDFAENNLVETNDIPSHGHMEDSTVVRPEAAPEMVAPVQIDTFCLSEETLDSAFNAILHHGYGDFFPDPPEWAVVESDWTELRTLLTKVDLYHYQPFRPTRAFAPKSKIFLRPVTLLHPVDLILYTALVARLVSAINDRRISESEARVFSFRFSGEDNELYGDDSSHAEFAEAKDSRARSFPTGYMGSVDIADFYSQLRHRPVREALDFCTEGLGDLSLFPVVVERFLQNLTPDAETYGIPIGPAASRPLAEAALIQIDDALLGADVDFIRYIDDFVIYGATREIVEWGIRKLGELLASQMGLSLHAAKTKLQRCSDYILETSTSGNSEDTVEARFAKLIEDHFYDESGRLLDELTESEREALDSVDLEKVLTEALDEDEIDYKKVAFILDRLSSLERADLIDIVMSHLGRLYPVAHALQSFFLTGKHLSSDDKKNAATGLLAPILAAGPQQAPEFYSIWILDLFRSDAAWNHAIELGRVFRNSGSQAIRRYGALALSVSGGRSEAQLLKEAFSSSDDMTRCALILGIGKLTAEEKKRWLERNELDWFEAFLVRHS